jgi:predicted transcriptional regulator
MSLTVRPDLEKQIAAVAGQRDPQAVLDDMIAAAVEGEERIIAGIREGIASAERGELIPHAVVFAKLEKKLLDKYGVRV